jgi:methanogenic corrinoid protein MtbC1
MLFDFLMSVRLSLPENEDGPVVLLTTLTGELHGLGLQMAAIVAMLAGARVRILGTDTPNEEIVKAADEFAARAVAVSISLATGGVQTDRIVRALREQLPDHVDLIVGGRGARGVRRGPRGVVYVKDLAELEEALKQR